MYLLSLLLLHIISFLDVKKNITIISIKSKVMDHRYIYLYISHHSPCCPRVDIAYIYSSDAFERFLHLGRFAAIY